MSHNFSNLRVVPQVEDNNTNYNEFSYIIADLLFDEIYDLFSKWNEEIDYILIYSTGSRGILYWKRSERLVTKWIKGAIPPHLTKPDDRYAHRDWLVEAGIEKRLEDKYELYNVQAHVSNNKLFVDLPHSWRLLSPEWM